MADAPLAGRRPARGRGTIAVLRALLRQRRRLLLAGVAIALGVGYLAGALGLLDRIGAGLDELATVSADDADLVIEGEVAYESSLEQVRRLVPSALLEATVGIPGVESASHRLEDTALLFAEDGEPVVAPSLSEQPLGVNWPEDDSISALEFTEGGPPREPTEVAIDERSAGVAGVGVGDEVTVAGKGKVGGYEVSGLVDSSATGSGEGSSLLVLTTSEARLVFDRPVDDNRIALTLTPGADIDEVAQRITAVSPPGVIVVDNDTAARHAQESLTRSFSLVRALVVGFGVLALAVGMLTVANSLGLLHAQRRRLFASFRLVGASVGQLRRAAFTEAGLLALVSSLVGIPVGLFIAFGIERALGALGTAVPTAGPVLTPRAALVAIGVGLVATIVAAWRPVTSACRVPPVEAVSEADPPPAKGWAGLAVVFGRSVVLAALAMAVALLAGMSITGVALAAVITAAFVLLLGASPWLLAQTVSGVMRLVPFRPRPLRRVAARDVARNPRRTASTTAAVLLAAAVVSSLAVFLESFTTSIDGAVDDLIVADTVVDSETFTRGGLPGDLVEQLGFVQGVDHVSGWQLGRGSIGDSGIRMTGLDGESALDVVSPQWWGTAPSGLDGGTMWISASLAERTGLGVGDTAPVVFTSGGTELLEVTGLYATGEALLGDMVTERSVLTRQVPATIDLAALAVTDGSASTREAVEELAGSYGVTSVVSPEEFVDERSDLLRGFQRVVQWMLLFTLLQALVGVVNTLVLSVAERRREFGLLRVSGASRSGVLRMVLFEGTSLAAVGTVLGLAVGVGGAALAVRALAGLGLDTFSVPLLTVLAIAIAALVVGVAAAWLPARVAAGVPPLEAVSDSGAEVRRKAVRPKPAPVPATTVPGPAPAPTIAPMAHAAAVLRGRAAPSASAQAQPQPLQAHAQPLQPQPAPAPSLLPPPFNPARLEAALAAGTVVGTAHNPAQAVAALDSSMPTDAAVGVAVWDGQSVHALDTDTDESAALLALYGPGGAAQPVPAAEAPAQVVPPQVVPPQVVPPQAVPPQVVPPVQTQAAAGPAPTSPPAPPVPPAFPAAAVPPPPPAMPPATAGGEPPTGRAKDRRARIADAATRFPRRRRTRRGAATGAAEGWLNPTASPSVAADLTEPAAAPAQPVALPVTPSGEDARRRAAELTERLRFLDAESVARSTNALGGFGQAMADGEQLGAVVVGRVKSWPAALGRTDRRLLLVVDRSDRLAVESLHPVATTVTVRPGASGSVTVVLVDQGRMLEVTEVVDSAIAESLTAREALTS